jgi:hypothetical protein
VKRLRILIWHIHGSYLDAITSVEHDWYLPVQPGSYGGRRWSSPEWVHDVPAERVCELDLDLVIFQTPKNYLEDQYEILSPEQRRLPRIYLEHNTPKPSAYDSHHPVDDPHVLLVHVTHFNRLMWDNGRTPTAVIEHSVAIDRSIRYTGTIERGITVVNGMQYRPRIAGYDIFLKAREAVPLDACGIDTELFGGLGDIPYRYLHRRMAEYRFLFSPMRYTSLPLAVVEAMTIGMPVVALATTEVPTVIEDGKNGYVSCDLDDLTEKMRFLLSHPEEARRVGDRARTTAESRFGMERFVREWNMAFEHALGLGR